MLYITEIHKSQTGTRYKLYDTHTGSARLCSYGFIYRYIRTGTEIKNATVVDGTLVIKKWPNSIKTFVNNEQSGCNNILIAKISDNKFKIVSNTDGELLIDDTDLKKLIVGNNVANCSYEMKQGEVVYKSIDTIDVTEDIEFNNYIEKQYSVFSAKSSLMGIDMSFDYEVEGKEVRLIKYTGTSKKVMIPSFITSIKWAAFFDQQIEHLKLTEGLKYIGESAFGYNRIGSLEIPDSLVLYWDGAFDNNSELYNNGGVKVNKYTLIIGRDR